MFSDYCLCITLYAAILMIHHRWIKKYEDTLLAYTCCLCCTLHKKPEPESKPEPETNGSTDNPPATLHRMLSARDGVGAVEEYRFIEKFLGRTWSGWMNKTKMFNLIFFVILFAVALGLSVSNFEPEDNPTNWFREGSVLDKLFQLLAGGSFGASDSDGLISVYITYGIEGVDRSNRKSFDGNNIGDVMWDSDFSMWTNDQQEYLYRTCQELKNVSLVYEPPNSEFVKCPIEEWKDYLIASGESFPYDASSESAFAEMWNSFLNSDNAENTMAHQLSYVENDDGDYTVKFYAMYMELSITFYGASPTVVENYRDDIDDYIDENEKSCPGTMCDSMYNAALKWDGLVTEKEYIHSAFQGIGIALPISFVVLLISTQNWIVSIFALLDIIGVMSCELFFMTTIAGWKFGFVESIATIMVIGFSVGMYRTVVVLS